MPGKSLLNSAETYMISFSCLLSTWGWAARSPAYFQQKPACSPARPPCFEILSNLHVLLSLLADGEVALLNTLLILQASAKNWQMTTNFIQNPHVLFCSSRSAPRLCKASSLLSKKTRPASRAKEAAPGSKMRLAPGEKKLGLRNKKKAHSL